MELKFGCDPEFFLVDGNGKYISAHGLFPGTKHEPYELDKGAVQVDGLALEFNINPVKDEDEFASNIKIVLTQIDEMIQKINPELTPRFIPFATFDRKYFENEVPDEAKILGCDPDFNYTGKVNVAPTIGNNPVRTAAGHIHIGWTNDEDPFEPGHFEDCRFIANKAYNSRLYRPVTQEEAQRLRYYGMFGSFRAKPYGVELRSPSNIWVASDKGRREMFKKTASFMQEIVKQAEEKHNHAL